MIFPEKLKKGDKVAIISPATIVKEEYIAGACARLRERGYIPVVMAGANGPADGSFASGREQRLADLLSSLEDPEIKAILCARGGYGCVHLLPGIPMQVVRNNPKWLIGFSDISALHALWIRAGVASLHAPMAKHLTIEPDDDPSTLHLFHILEEGVEVDYSVPPHPFNRYGHAEGILRGGNLAVLNGLASTPYDILALSDNEEVILFIEDISEAIYAVERMLMRLYLSGTLSGIKGLIVGQFTEYRPDRNHDSMEAMIHKLLTRYGIDSIPVAFGFPVGHVTLNYPLPEGGKASLCVNSEGVELKINDYGNPGGTGIGG